MSEQPYFQIPVQVRFRDIDALGHVNNAVVFTYYEEGRKQFFMEHFSTLDATDFNFILAHIRCDYHRPIRMHDQPLLQIAVGAIGSKSFTFKYRLVDHNDHEMVWTTGESVQVCYDYHKNQSVGLPAEMRSLLARYQSRAGHGPNQD